MSVMMSGVMWDCERERRLVDSRAVLSVTVTESLLVRQTEVLMAGTWGQQSGSVTAVWLACV